MSPPGTFDRVYAAIKQRLREGWFRPGEKLEPGLLSEDFNASVTPVRDALHRLTGERLLEAPRQEGFRAPMLTETMLRHLYDWHLDILLLAISRRTSGTLDEGAVDAGDGKVLGRVFEGLAQQSGNPEHSSALRNLEDRLQPYRRFEEEFLDAVEAEADAILCAVRRGDRPGLRRALLRYHRRRQRIVPALVAAALG